ncbi:MAG: hypothetical protein KDI79_15375 [Anaerolineae bacterium]|nr:hypothetical protein [Anaerolineae bacterium]
MSNQNSTPPAQTGQLSLIFFQQYQILLLQGQIDYLQAEIDRAIRLLEQAKAESNGTQPALTPQEAVLAAAGELTQQGQTWFTQEDILTVRAAVDLRAQLTGLTIPAGTVGRVLAADRDSLTVDFGLATVHRLPRDTHLVEVQ